MQHFSGADAVPADQVVQGQTYGPPAPNQLVDDLVGGINPNAPQDLKDLNNSPNRMPNDVEPGITGVTMPSVSAKPGPAEEKEPPSPPESSAPAAPEVSSKPPSVEFPKLKIPSGGVPGADDETKKAYGQREEAEQAKANIADQLAQETLKLQQQHEVERQALTKQWADKWEANQKQSDQVAADIAASKIDPKQYWNNHSRITAGISLILGGIGAGLSGGPNQSLALLNKNIDNELEAQKANLGKKQNLLSHYVQQGHSIQEAQQLARADLLDAQRGQLQMMATKYAGPQAQVAAADAIGQLRAQAIKDRQEGYTKTLLNKKTALDVQLEMQQARMAPAMMQAKIASESGAVLPASSRAFIDNARAVNVPGGVTLANTSKDRDEAVDAQQALRDGLSAAKRVRELGSRLGMGGNDTKLGEAALLDLKNAYQSALGRSNAPRGKQEEEMEQAWSNPTSWTKSQDSINEQMDAFEKSIRKHVASALSTRLVGGLKAAQGIVGAK